jgi:hypothetical protein
MQNVSRNNIGSVDLRSLVKVLTRATAKMLIILLFILLC